jgi:hypothetical protein
MARLQFRHAGAQPLDFGGGFPSEEIVGVFVSQSIRDIIAHLFHPGK